MSATSRRRHTPLSIGHSTKTTRACGVLAATASKHVHPAVIAASPSVHPDRQSLGAGEKGGPKPNIFCAPPHTRACVRAPQDTTRTAIRVRVPRTPVGVLPCRTKRPPSFPENPASSSHAALCAVPVPPAPLLKVQRDGYTRSSEQRRELHGHGRAAEAPPYALLCPLLAPPLPSLSLPE
jgi:hypothetical protein